MLRERPEGPKTLESGDDDPVRRTGGQVGGRVYWALSCVGDGRGGGIEGENGVVVLKPTKPETEV